MAQSASIADPYLRETNTFLEALKYKIPGARQTLYPVRDWTGTPVANSREGLGAFLKSKAVNTDPVDLEMQRLGIKPTLPEKTVRGIKLESGQYDELQSLAGPLIRPALKTLMDDPSWKTTPMYAQQEMFRRTLTMAHRMAGTALQLRHPDIVQQGLQLKMDKIMGH